MRTVPTRKLCRRKVVDPNSGYPYWFHKKTKETTWLPETRGVPICGFATRLRVESTERIFETSDPVTFLNLC